MALVPFLALLLLGCVVALLDWRRGWYLALLCGVLQDPARKMTAGTPVIMTFSIVVIYVVILFSAQATLRRNFLEATRRFSQVYAAGLIVMLFLALAAINGIFTYGIALWKAPAISLFTYLVPIPAVLLGYAFVEDESRLWSLLTFYAVITCAALVGGALEYKGLHWSALGTVAMSDD